MEVCEIVDGNLYRKTKTEEGTTFNEKIKADYYRYLCEFTTGDE